MTPSTHPLPHHATAARLQQGSALFLALMLLIVLSLLALSVASVTALQERMASAYRAEHLAFERAEARLRATERSILDEIDPCHAASPDPSNDWLAATPAAPEQNYRNMSRGEESRAFGWRGSIRAGQPAMVGDIQCAYFEISAIDHDTIDAGNATSHSFVTSTFVP